MELLYDPRKEEIFLTTLDRNELRVNIWKVPVK